MNRLAKDAHFKEGTSEWGKKPRHLPTQGLALPSQKIRNPNHLQVKKEDTEGSKMGHQLKALATKSGFNYQAPHSVWRE